MTRRNWLALLAGLLGTGVIGCGKHAEAEDEEDPPLPPNRLPPIPKPAPPGKPEKK